MRNMRTISCLCFGLSVLWTLTNAQYVPKITYLHVVSEIDYRFSRTIITTKMVNNRQFPKEAQFDVDLPNEAFITGFKLTVRGIDYHGKVKEREIAEREFQAAKARGETTGTVVARQRNTNSFQVKVNVAANDEVIFELTYRELLKRTKGYYSHVIYLNPGQLVEDFLVSVMITESRTITTIKIPPLQKGLLHDGPMGKNDQTSVEYFSKTQAMVTYQPTLKQQAELSDGGVSGKFIVQYDIERFNDAGEILVMDGYFVHYLAPEGLQPIPMDIVFVFDKSGSMEPLKISQLKAAMFRILDDVKPADRISMISFSHSVHDWGRGMIPADNTNILAAKQFVKEQMAFGGTNINYAITKGLADLNNANQGNRPAIMVFLTDGKPTIGETNPEKILQNVYDANEFYIPIFTLAFGKEADYELVRKIATQNFGFARKIFEDADAALQIAGFYDEIAGLLLEDVEFKYLDGTLYDSTVTDTKFKNYFKGTELIVSGHVENVDRLQEGMTIKGKSYGRRNVTMNYPPNQCTILPYKDEGLPIGQKHPGMMEKLWAYLTIKQLLEKREAIDILQEIQQIEAEVIRISLKYHFVTPLTSMIVTLPNQQQVEPCTCGAIPKTGSTQGISNTLGSSSGIPVPPILPGHAFSRADIDRHLGFPVGAFAKKKEKKAISVAQPRGGTQTIQTPEQTPKPKAGGPIHRIPRPPQGGFKNRFKEIVPPKKVAPTPRISPPQSRSPTPTFVAKLSGMMDSVCFNLPLAERKTYNLLKVDMRGRGYVFDATMGRKLVDTLKVIRKIMRRQIPKTLRKTVKDEIVHSQRERISGLLIKVLSKANGLLINFEVLHKRGNPGGLLGVLRDLGATITSKTGGMATISMSNGSNQRTVTASEITYNSRSNKKCWFIKDVDMAALKINVRPFIKA